MIRTRESRDQAGKQTCDPAYPSQFLCFVLRTICCRPVLRVGIIRGRTGKERRVLRCLVIHIFCGCLCFLHTLIGFLALLQDNGVPCPQVFLGFLRKAQPAIRPYTHNSTESINGCYHRSTWKLDSTAADWL